METTLKSAPLWSVPEHTAVAVGPSVVSVPQALRAPEREFPRKTPPNGTREYRIPNLARACQVLRLFASSEEPLSSSAVARRLKMPRTTVLRILHTLAAERLLQRRGFDFLASTELRMGLRSMADNSVRAAAIPVLQELSQITGESTHLALLSGHKAVVVETCEGPNTSAGAWTRKPVDLHGSALGKVLLALGPAPELESLLAAPLAALTKRTLVSSEALKAECGRIARQGYAVDNEENEDGVRCLAAPVWGAGGVLIGAIGLSGSVMALAEPRQNDIAAQVVQAAKRLSTSLG
jgi:DNA-binding IclR family transcriptional regulator